MRKRIVCKATAIILSLNMIAPSLVAGATPSEEAKKSQSKYEELQEKVNQINEKVSELDAEINPLAIKINENNEKIETIGEEVNTTNKEIEELKEDIEDKEEILGKRLREVYKSGGQTNYLSLIFSAESFSDLILKIDSANTVINIDKKIVNELNDSKESLNTKVSDLENKAKEVEALNAEIETKVEELTAKKDEQVVLVEQAKAEQEAFEGEFLIPAEREMVKTEIAKATNINSELSVIKSNLSYLKNIKSQLKSSTVISEVDNAIEKANTLVSQKTAQQAAQQTAATTNRGGSLSSNSGSVSSSSTPSVTVSGNVQNLINYAYNFLGRPYVWGATGPDSFDCSGFTSYVFRNAAGINIGRTTYDQLNVGRAVSQSELQPGDLVFPHTGHVGIYIGNGKMIHSPQTGDVVKVGNVYKFYTARRILG